MNKLPILHIIVTSTNFAMAVISCKISTTSLKNSFIQLLLPWLVDSDSKFLIK